MRKRHRRDGRTAASDLSHGRQRALSPVQWVSLQRLTRDFIGHYLIGQAVTCLDALTRDHPENHSS